MTRSSRPGRRTALLIASAISVVAAAACSVGGTSPSPAGQSAPPAAAAVPSPAAVPSAASGPVGSLESPEDPAERLQARLLEILDAPDLAYRFEQTADITSSDASLQQAVTGEVSGQDLHMTITVEQGDERTVTEVAILAGTAFQRSGDGPWTRSGSTTAETSIVPQLADIFDATTLRYAGHELHQGGYLQHLTMRAPMELTGALTQWLPSQATTGTLDSLDLYLESDGTPVDITYEMTFDVAFDASSDPVQLHGVYHSNYIDLGQDVRLEVNGLTPA